MRISDWSSDVCSSDLKDARRVGGIAQHEVDDALRMIILMRLPKGMVLPGGDEDRTPLGRRGVRPRQRDAEPRIDQPRIVFAPFKIARHPIEATGSFS